MLAPTVLAQDGCHECAHMNSYVRSLRSLSCMNMHTYAYSQMPTLGDPTMVALRWPCQGLWRGVTHRNYYRQWR